MNIASPQEKSAWQTSVRIDIQPSGPREIPAMLPSFPKFPQAAMYDVSHAMLKWLIRYPSSISGRTSYASSRIGGVGSEVIIGIAVIRLSDGEIVDDHADANSGKTV